MEFSFCRSILFSPCEARERTKNDDIFAVNKSVQAPNVDVVHGESTLARLDTTRLNLGWLNSTIIQQLEFTTWSKCVCSCVLVWVATALIEGIITRWRVPYLLTHSFARANTHTKYKQNITFMGFYSAQAAFKDLIAHSFVASSLQILESRPLVFGVKKEGTRDCHPEKIRKYFAHTKEKTERKRNKNRE